MKKLFVVLILVFSCGALAKQYRSKSLKTTDYEEIRNIINTHIKTAQSYTSAEDGEDLAVSELKKGLKILLMRPDTDSIRSSLLLILQNEIIQYRSFMNILGEIIDEALAELKAEAGDVAYQVSLIYIVENVLSHLQSINNRESDTILSRIKRANIKVSKEISNSLFLEMERGRTTSPSYIAGRILEGRLKAKEEEQEARRKETAKEKRKEKKRQPSAVKNKNSKGSKTQPKINLDIDDGT